ncbi:MAG: lytic murein transglycosylase B [Thiohalophilus sp.]
MKRSLPLRFTLFWAGLCLGFASHSHAGDFSGNVQLQSFIQEMSEQHEFDSNRLQTLFENARLHQSILDAISRPAESKPWHEYRPIFVTRERTRGGVRFWRQNHAALQRAEEKFGVPPQIITAIIGVETRYGQHAGRYSVLDALATLAFAYPPRSSFFRKELKEYLLMTREEELDPLEQKGSYAGAMGMPQFISSSFRNYAIDFDGDGKRDLWDNPEDVIGSVAHYFHKHRWKPGQPIAHKVKVHGTKYSKLISDDLRPRFTQQELLDNGVILPRDIPRDIKGTLIELETEDGPEYWVTWHNFYVISRYNHSALYAMAAYQLSELIAAARNN